MVLRSSLASSVIRVGQRCPELEPGETVCLEVPSPQRHCERHPGTDRALRTDPGFKAVPPTSLSFLGQGELGAAQRDKIRRLVVLFFF